jgi:hypothetical protein
MRALSPPDKRLYTALKVPSLVVHLAQLYLICLLRSACILTRLWLESALPVAGPPLLGLWLFANAPTQPLQVLFQSAKQCSLFTSIFGVSLLRVVGMCTCSDSQSSAHASISHFRSHAFTAHSPALKPGNDDKLCRPTVLQELFVYRFISLTLTLP